MSDLIRYYLGQNPSGPAMPPQPEPYGGYDAMESMMMSNRKADFNAELEEYRKRMEEESRKPPRRQMPGGFGQENGYGSMGPFL